MILMSFDFLSAQCALEGGNHKMLSCKETTEEEEAAVLLQSKLAQKIPIVP